MPDTDTDAITLTCPGKINLALSVAAPRPTDGMHPIASWMAALDFGDDLQVTRADTTHYDIAFTDDAPAHHTRCTVDWPLDKDLAVRAHRLLESHAARTLPIHLTLRKRIPAGAGLAGGSSNAAATLIALDCLFRLHLTDELPRLAAQLGSDIPFLVRAIQGHPAAIVTGLGDTFHPLPSPPRIDLALLFPPFGCPTGPVYHAFDAQPITHPIAPDIDRVQQLARQHPLPPDAPFNDLAQPAITVEPRLRSIINAAAERSITLHITGSGSTLFTIARSPDHARDLADQLHHLLDLPAIATHARTPVI